MIADIQSVVVYCASSDQVDKAYHQAAFRVGELLADAGKTLIYGGGARGSMGAVADGALSRSGHVIGVLPKFMDDLEWGHPGLSDLQLVETMHERKHRMLTQAQAVIALPGGCGTFEELFEAMTFKRLGLFTGPIVLLNTLGYYDLCEQMLNQAVDQHFMGSLHQQMWSMADEPEQLLSAIANASEWTEDHRAHAVQSRTDRVPTGATHD